MQHTLTGQRVLITQADEFMGPALCEVFAGQGAEVVASTADLAPPQAAAQVVAQSVQDGGPIDVLVANLAYRAPTTPARGAPLASRPACAAARPFASWGRYSRCAAVGWRAEACTTLGPWKSRSLPGIPAPLHTFVNVSS